MRTVHARSETWCPRVVVVVVVVVCLTWAEGLYVNVN